MKKTLILLFTSLMFLAGCQKEDPQQEENSIGNHTKEVTCKCGAKYSVTRTITGTVPPGSLGEGEWILYDKYPSGYWAVKNDAGEYVPFYEHMTRVKIKFSCEECGADMGEIHRSDF